MPFGLFLRPLHPPERSFAEAYERDLAPIELADRLGYHWDHQSLRLLAAEVGPRLADLT